MPTATVAGVISNLHEVLVELFRQRPTLAPELLTGALGTRLPGYDGARVESAELTDLNSAEYRADNVVVLTDTGRRSRRWSSRCS